jgi:hypothetical protein
MSLGWAPPNPAQWEKGQRAFACTFTQVPQSPVRYAAVFTKALPVASRTCIDNNALAYVACARPHDREVLAVLEVKAAVAAGALPGRKAVTKGVNGRIVGLPQDAWARLDAACTTYLRAVSTVKRLTGLAEADPKHWPTAEGSFPVSCEADVPLGQPPLVRTGSVYDRG